MQSSSRNKNGPVIKNVAKFDGTNYLNIPYTPQLNTPRFSISVWVNTQQSVHGQRMFDNFNNITTRHGYAVSFNSSNNKYGFYLEDSST